MTPDQIVEFAEGLARVAAAGGGAKALAAHLSDATGAGVLVEDADWRHVATAGKGSLPATARGQNNGRAHTVPIAAGTTQLGCLRSSRGPTGSTTTWRAIVRLAAAAIAVELAREADGGRGRRRTFWERLIGGRLSRAGSAREDASARGIALASHYSASRSKPKPARRRSRAARLAELRALAAEAFRSGEADVGIIERGATLLVFVPAAREVDAENAQDRGAPAAQERREAQTGIAHRRRRRASSVTALEAKRGVAGAEAALAIARRIYGIGRVAAYDELGAYPLLYAGAERRRICSVSRESVLAPLRAYDEKHQTELERTLELYFRRDKT